MSRVFVVQKTMRWNGRELVDCFDLSAAEPFGELIHLLSPTARPFNSAGIIAELHEKLEDFTDDDYLLLIGNPCLIGFATTIAAYYNEGRVRMLQWNGSEKKYIEVRADLHR